jgi:hypothetical protein
MIGFIGTTSVFSDWSERMGNYCSLHDKQYIATMRRLLVFTMILSLPAVTAMPVQAEEPVCKSAIQQTSEAVAGDTMAKPPVQANAVQGHGHERIECGCGCHLDIDGLPHVLEPHTLMQTELDVAMSSLYAPWPTAPARSLQVYRLQPPPPRTLS